MSTDSNILPLPQEFLSEILGVQRTTVTMLARDIQEAGLIHYRRGRIEIVDRPRLEKRSCECYGVVQRKTDEIFSKPKN